MFAPDELWQDAQNLYLFAISYILFCFSWCCKLSTFCSAVFRRLCNSSTWWRSVRSCWSVVTVGWCWDEKLGWDMWCLSASSDAAIDWASVSELEIGGGGCEDAVFGKGADFLIDGDPGREGWFDGPATWWAFPFFDSFDGERGGDLDWERFGAMLMKQTAVVNFFECMTVKRRGWRKVLEMVHLKSFGEH